jgi:hypothetical protein
MLRFLDNLVHYADPTLPSFSSLTYLFLFILGITLAGAIRDRQYEQEERPL